MWSTYIWSEAERASCAIDIFLLQSGVISPGIRGDIHLAVHCEIALAVAFVEVCRGLGIKKGGAFACAYMYVNSDGP